MASDRELCDCCGEELSLEEANESSGTCFPCQKGNCPDCGEGE